MVQFYVFKTVLLNLLKLIHLYEHQQEAKVPFLAILGTFEMQLNVTFHQGLHYLLMTKIDVQTKEKEGNYKC